jgi:predicted enzyme related to lactoylglutathione lyase
MSFDTVWQSKGRLTDFGYVVSFAIPFKSLRFPSAEGRAWGIALMRGIPANNEQAFWPGVTHTIGSFASQMADLHGLTGISPGRNIQLIPYGTFTGARFLDESTFDSKADGRVGLDAKVVAHDVVTIDLTANPDFSQVESDEPQVTINQRFEVFFPEKRPFFLENAGYFQTPINLFFSRRISDPQIGARATGKLGGWAAGALALDDRGPGHAVDAVDPNFGDRAFNAVGRVRREFGDSSVGAFVTSHDFGPTSNRVISADTRLKVNSRIFVDGQAAASDTESTEGERLRDSAYSATLNRSGRKLSYTVNYLDIGPDFRSTLGFVPRTDIRQGSEFLAFRWRPKTGFVHRRPELIRPGHMGSERSPAGLDRAISLRSPASRQSGYSCSASSRWSASRGSSSASTRTCRCNYFTSRVKWLDFNVSVAAGTRPNFYPGPGLAPFLADFRDISSGATFRPISGLLLDETYIYSHLGTRPEAGGTRATIFDNHIARSRVSYQVNRELSFRGILDYNGVLANPTLVDLDRTKHFSVDVLMTYLVHPGTAVYVGYTDGYDNIALDPDGVRTFTRHPSTSTGRQFFVKRVISSDLEPSLHCVSRTELMSAGERRRFTGETESTERDGEAKWPGTREPQRVPAGSRKTGCLPFRLRSSALRCELRYIRPPAPSPDRALAPARRIISSSSCPEAVMSDAKPRGRFVWFDLMTTEPEKAIEFYTKVVGWGTTQWEGPSAYTMWTNATMPLGGVMALPPESGAPPHWLAYISSPDVDATASQAEALGGKTLVAPNDVPTVGRFAVMSDPQGAIFAIFTPAKQAPGHEGPPVQGEFSWHELATREQPAAYRFYETLFGWNKTNAMDMGPIGQYQLFGRNGVELGGMYNKPAEMPGPPAWTHYMMVDDIQRAADAAKAGEARSSTVRWRCQAATGSSRPSIPRARCSRFTPRRRSRAGMKAAATSDHHSNRSNPEQTGSKRLRNSIAG